MLSTNILSLNNLINFILIKNIVYTNVDKFLYAFVLGTTFDSPKLVDSD